MSDYLIELGRKEYVEFSQRIAGSFPKLTFGAFANRDLCNELAYAGKDLFGDVIESMQALLIDPSVGLSAVDIARDDASTDHQNLVIGAAAATAICASLFESRTNPIGQTPFWLHMTPPGVAKASGIDIQYNNTTDVVLHTDWYCSNDEAYVPNRIGLFNLLVSYKRPGNFHWLPFSKWSEFTEFSKNDLLRSDISFELLPQLLVTKDGNSRFGEKYLRTGPIVKDGEAGPIYFLNGRIDRNGRNSTQTVAEFDRLRSALKESYGRFEIAQAERRLIVLNNLTCFHGRDRMEDPIPGAPVQRAFLRFMDDTRVSFGKTQVFHD
ncbi:hypothetical protein [Paraburkholderia sp. BCC1876]|uniref:hypothetical protein n=1 Tax=Paraburkholderia sp. BCC1876 TaxID=2676303 RepID=UPI001591D9D4|nr:hypothetical protein [Paraburkholderia sp. BCC1876]